MREWERPGKQKGKESRLTGVVTAFYIVAAAFLPSRFSVSVPHGCFLSSLSLFSVLALRATIPLGGLRPPPPSLSAWLRLAGLNARVTLKRTSPDSTACGVGSGRSPHRNTTINADLPLPSSQRTLRLRCGRSSEQAPLLERGPVLWFSPEDQTPNATGFVHAPQRPDDRKFGSSRVLQINLPPPALSIRSRRPDHRPRQSVAFWFSRAPRRGSLQRTSHATPIFGRVRPLTSKAAQPSPARGWPRDHAAAQSLARTPLARQQPAPALPPPTPQAPSTTPPTLRTPEKILS